MTLGFGILPLASACECTTISKKFKEMKWLPYCSAEEMGNRFNLPLN